MYSIYSEYTKYLLDHKFKLNIIKYESKNKTNKIEPNYFVINFLENLM